jgi:predicted TIM-barrel fold metal-dependent hydrolase
MRPNVWIEISGLPPQKLPEYYARYDFERLAKKMIFGTDWPGVPGNRANALVLFELGLERETLQKILYKNALRVYRLDEVEIQKLSTTKATGEPSTFDFD